MNKITRTLISELARQHDGMRLTIYQPTHRHPTPPHMQEDQTRYKNLIRQARGMWQQASEGDATRKIYRQLEARLDDLLFWQQMTEGLAIFASVEGIRMYHLSIECEERVTVSDTYEVTPLYALLSYDQPYYLLVLAVRNPKLFYGDMYGIRQIEIEFPSSPEEAFGIDEMFSNSNTVRGREGTGTLADAISPHGQGDSNEAGTEERLQYFRIIDSMVINSKEVDTTLPLLISGTEDDTGDYQVLTKYPVVVPTFLPGNHGATRPQDLHALAWPIIQADVVEARTAAALGRFHELWGAGRASRDMQDIRLAAEAGRVATLFLPMLNHGADSISDVPDTNVPLLTFPEHYDQLAEIARLVFTQGGEIVGTASDLMPDNSVIAAIYRY